MALTIAHTQHTDGGHAVYESQQLRVALGCVTQTHRHTAMRGHRRATATHTRRQLSVLWTHHERSTHGRAHPRTRIATTHARACRQRDGTCRTHTVCAQSPQARQASHGQQHRVRTHHDDTAAPSASPLLLSTPRRDGALAGSGGSVVRRAACGSTAFATVKRPDRAAAAVRAADLYLLPET